MGKKLIERRCYNNCVASLETENGKLTVSGMYFIGFRGNRGPKVELTLEIPKNLQKEVETLSSWQDHKSHNFKQFCQKCYEAASQKDYWFASFVNK